MANPTYSGKTVPGGGTTSVTVGTCTITGTALNASSIRVVYIWSKPGGTAATLSGATGYTSLGAVSLGTGTNGTNTGPVECTAWYKPIGSTDESTTINVSGTGACIYAQAFVFTSSTSTDHIDTVMLSGSQTTSTTSWSVSLGNPPLLAGDGIFYTGCKSSSTGTRSTDNYSATGLTLAGATGLDSGASSNGNHLYAWDSRGSVTSGTETGNFTLTATLSAADTGGYVAFYLRTNNGTTWTGGETADAGVTDNTSLAQTKVPTDDGGVTDTTALSQAKVAADDAGVTDSALVVPNKFFTDSAGVTDSVLVVPNKIVTDDAGVTDSQAFVQSKVVTDDGGLVDTTAFSQSRVFTDDGGVTDSALVEVFKVVAATDDAGVSDTAAFTQGKVVTDAAVPTDTTAITQGKVVTDSAGVTDSSLVEVGKVVTATDDAGVTDSYAITQSKVVTDPGGLTDSQAFTQSKVVTDNAVPTDSTATLQFKVVTDSEGLTDSATESAISTTVERAISVSGAEFTPSTITATQLFSNVNVQTYDSDYRYEGVPTTISSANHLTFSYLYSRGFRTVKIPIRWERIQRTLGGALDTTEVSRLTKELDMANTAGLKVVLDIHNYGLYYLDGSQKTPPGTTNTGYRFPIGSTTVTQAHFADLWSRLATQFGSHAAIKGYHIMNEPQDNGGLTRSVWYSCAQAAVDAIRLVDTNAIIRVGGWLWSDMRNWTTNNPSGPWITDTVSGKLWYEAHHYWDQDASGGYTTYADALAQAVTEGYTAGSNPDALYTKIITQLNDWITWLNSNGVTGVVGELSWPGNSTTTENNKWNALAHAYMVVADTNNISLDWWSTGELYGNPPDPLLFYYASGTPNPITTGVDTQRASAPELEEHLFPGVLGGEFTDSAGVTDSFSISLSKVVTDSAGVTDNSVVGGAITVNDLLGLTNTVAYMQGKGYIDLAGVTDSVLIELYASGGAADHPDPGGVLAATIAAGGVAVVIAGTDDATDDSGGGFDGFASGGGIISGTGGGGIA